MNKIGHRVYTYSSSSTFTEVLRNYYINSNASPKVYYCIDGYLYLVWGDVWYRSDKAIPRSLFFVIASECWAGTAYRVVFVDGTQVDFHPLSDVEIEITRVFGS